MEAKTGMQREKVQQQVLRRKKKRGGGERIGGKGYISTYVDVKITQFTKKNNLRSKCNVLGTWCTHTHAHTHVCTHVHTYACTRILYTLIQ